MSTEVNKMSNNKPEKKDKITIEIDHKWGKFLGAALTLKILPVILKTYSF
jgi:hypothetical protein